MDASRVFSSSCHEKISLYHVKRASHHSIKSGSRLSRHFYEMPSNLFKSLGKHKAVILPKAVAPEPVDARSEKETLPLPAILETMFSPGEEHLSRLTMPPTMRERQLQAPSGKKRLRRYGKPRVQIGKNIPKSCTNTSSQLSLANRRSLMPRLSERSHYRQMIFWA